MGLQLLPEREVKPLPSLKIHGPSVLFSRMAERRSVHATHHPSGPNPGLKAYFSASPFFLLSEPLAFYNRQLETRHTDGTLKPRDFKECSGFEQVEAGLE